MFIQKKNRKSTDFLFVMQKMGLEPTRYCYHRHLKPARLPIPPLLRTNRIMPQLKKNVKQFFEKINLIIDINTKIKKIEKIQKSTCHFYGSLILYRSCHERWQTCGSVGTGRRARLRILCSLRACGFKSHLPH